MGEEGRIPSPFGVIGSDDSLAVRCERLDASDLSPTCQPSMSLFYLILFVSPRCKNCLFLAAFHTHLKDLSSFFCRANAEPSVISL